MALAIDGSVHGNAASSVSLAVNLTTTQSNDYIIVAIEANTGPVVSVSSVALGSFTRMAASAGFSFVEEVWYKFSSGILTADTITVTQNGIDFITVDAFGVSGSGQISAVFDSGGPQTTAGADPLSITTTNPNTMVVGCFRPNNANPTAGAGFTQLSGADWHLVEYKLLSTAQTLSCTIGTGAGTCNGVIVFGIVTAVVGGPILGANQKLLVM